MGIKATKRQTSPVLLMMLLLLLPLLSTQSGCSVNDLNALGRPCGPDAPCGPGTHCDPRLAICVVFLDAAQDASPAREGIQFPDTFVVPDGGCPAGYTQCGAACAKLPSDPKHCGSCDKACTGVTDRCVNGGCVCGSTGGACTGGLDCVAGQCKCIVGGQCAGCCDGTTCRPPGSQSASTCGQGGAACKSCDDGKPCTADSCSAVGSCGNTPLKDGASCDDTKGCTHSDSCKGGVCQGTGYSCSDGLKCTTDTCTGKAPPVQCTFIPIAGHCLIQGQCHADGAVSSADPCAACRTTRSSSIWSLASGCVDTLAGSGIYGHKDGAAAQAQFNSPNDVAVDSKGVIYVADRNNDVIRAITAGMVSTLAGQPGVSGFKDGPAATALLDTPYGVEVSAGGKVYAADRGNNRIRLIAGGAVSTLVGSGVAGSQNGPALSAQLNSPRSVFFTSAGKLIIADTQGDCIRQLVSGAVSTLAGTCGLSGYKDGAAATALFSDPRYVTADSAGKVYVGDTNNDVIRVISGGNVTTLAGTGLQGFKDGPAAQAQFDRPVGVLVSASGTVYVADWHNARIRAISTAGVVSTLGGDGTKGLLDGPLAQARFGDPYGLALDLNGDLLVAERGNHVVRIISF
jgi:sugar lactone lactonase YvrE